MFELIQPVVTEYFNSESRPNTTIKNKTIIALISFVIMYLLVLLFGQYLWNNILVVLIPNIKPVTSVLQLIGLKILLGLIFHH